ncbi:MULTISPECIES: alpha/beta fold hydrolase [unclassified Cryobacterium]|uniref:alpha/beta fold hydrolase n=1 Tax=unclassified Cryobacterium TaxID=2649013 RepID=UPI0014467CEC|nr:MULTISPECIES: alpha/beta hydrolase [unclassified Cryobacterium]
MSVTSPYATRLASIPIRRRETEVLGSTTRYWEYGDPDAEHTVVVAHGYRGEHHGLEPVIAHLPGIRFIGPDLPGFGESTPLTEVPHSIDGYAKWFQAFVDDLGLTGEALILGHSFGTIVTSHAFASGMQAPALMLINPIAMPGLDGPRKFATALTVGYYRAASKLPTRLGDALLRNRMIVQFMSSNLVKTKDRDLRRWIHDQHHTYFNNFSDRDTVVEAFDASISADVSEYAERITVPTLLVAAELDDITPVSAQYTLQERFPDATLRVLGGVGHLIHYEVPERAADAIRDFVDALK